jgi:hypothetical protein
MTPPADSKPHILWFIVLLLPLIGVVSVAAYSYVDPMAWGVPYFFQFLWVLLSAAITAINCIQAAPRYAVICTGRSARPRA